jgi:hypothetical protein
MVQDVSARNNSFRCRSYAARRPDKRLLSDMNSNRRL